MGKQTSAGLALAALSLLLAVGCRGESGPAGGGPADLKGKTVGVVSLNDVSTLATRYVLQKAYGLDTSQKRSTVTFVEVPAEALAGELLAGRIDAAVLSQAGAFRLLGDGRFRVISHVSQEMKKLSGGPVASSVLVSYPDVAEQKPDALKELDRLLATSVAYYKANEQTVLPAVAAQQEQDPAFLRWQAGRQELPLGDLSTETQARLLRTWRAAAELGDIDRVPEMAALLFAPATGQSAASPGSRVTVSLALLDDPSRRAALYAIEQGVITSESIDVSVTYLPASALAEAATTKQYDVIEALALIIPASTPQDLGFVVLSAGAADLGGTFLFVRSERSARQ